MGVLLQTVFLLPVLWDSTFNVFAQELKFYDEGVYLPTNPPYNEVPRLTDDVSYSETPNDEGSKLPEESSYPEVPKYEEGDLVLTKERLDPEVSKYEGDGNVLSGDTPYTEVPKYVEDIALSEHNPYPEVPQYGGENNVLSQNNPDTEIPKSEEDVALPEYNPYPEGSKSEEDVAVPEHNPDPEVPILEGEGSVPSYPEDSRPEEVNPEQDTDVMPEDEQGDNPNDDEGVENVPDEEIQPENIPEDSCYIPDLIGFTDKVLSNVRQLVPNTVDLPNHRKGPFRVQSFTLAGLSYFSRKGYPELVCSKEYGTHLKVPVYWSKPLVGDFQVSFSNKLNTPVKVILDRLEAELVLEFSFEESSYYIVYVRSVRFTRSDGLRVFTKNVGRFRSKTSNKLGAWLADFVQARIRSFLSRQFQELLDEYMLHLTVKSG